MHCWVDLERLTAGAVGDWHGARQHCQRVEAQARSMAADGDWRSLVTRTVEAWVERQRSRNRPLVVRYLANDFAEVVQQLNQQSSNGKQTNFADDVIAAYERREKLLVKFPHLTGQELLEMDKLKTAWQKYKDNGKYYDQKATGT